MMRFKILGLLAVVFSAAIYYSTRWISLKDNFKSTENAPWRVQESTPQSSIWNAYQQYLSGRNSRDHTPGLLTDVKELGPYTLAGRVRAGLVDRKEEIYLAAANGGGLWRFHPDQEGAWAPLDDNFPSLDIVSIAQDPFNPSTIFIGTGDRQDGPPGAGLFISDDKGKNFTRINSIDPHLDKFWYIEQVLPSRTVKDLLYVASMDNWNSYIHRSTDGGHSFEEVFSVAGRLWSVDFSIEERLVLAIAGSGLFYSVDGSEGSFVKIDQGIPFFENSDWSSSPYQAVEVTFCESQPLIGYALFAARDYQSTCYKTTDGGLTWNEIAKPSTILYSQPGFVNAFRVAPFDPDFLVSGGLNWGYSDDGGQSWKYGASLEADFHDFLFDRDSTNLVYALYDQGVGSLDFNTMVNKTIWTPEGVKDIEIPGSKAIGQPGNFNTAQIYYGGFFLLRVTPLPWGHKTGVFR